MGKLSASQLARIVRLELVPEHISADEVKHHLGPYGTITDVQFWRSNANNRHGFVTFHDSKAARLCLEHAHVLSSALRVKPLHPSLISRYKTPPQSPKRRTKSIGAADDQSPSLIHRMSLNQPTTPTRHPHLHSKQDSTLLVPANGPSELPPAPLSSTRRVESNLASNGTHESPQQRKPSINDIPMPGPQSLPAKPSQSYYWKPDLPNTEASQVRERDASMYAASEKKRREDQIAQLNDEIQGLHNTIRNIKNSNDIALEDVTKRALHYKRERDDLGASLEAADRSAKYYRTLSEELKRDLNRERGMQGDKERALQRDLRDSSKDVSELKRQLDVQSRLLSQRTSELSQSRQQLRAMNLGKAAPKIRFPEKYKDAKSDSQQARNSSEPEEGQLNDRQPGPSSPPAQASSHHQTVLPMLEKAFIYLEELTNAALLEAHPVEQRDSDSPKNRKRQRLT